MTVDNNAPKAPAEMNDKVIDVMAYLSKLWVSRRLIYKVTGIAMALGILIAFTTPKTYSVKVILAPESTKSSSGSLASAASMLGLGNLSLGSDNDALKISNESNSSTIGRISSSTSGSSSTYVIF